MRFPRSTASADPSTAPSGGRTLGRSVRLLRAFRLEQTDPDGFYNLLAEDAVRLLGRHVELAGRRVLDVGGGAGYLANACRAAGARAAVVEP